VRLVLRGDAAAVAVRGFSPAALAPGRRARDSSAGRGGGGGGGMIATVGPARGKQQRGRLCVGAGPHRLEVRGGARGGLGLEFLHAIRELLVTLR